MAANNPHKAADAIADNVANRKAAESLFAAMLDAVRNDFLKLSQHGRIVFFEMAHRHFAKKLDLSYGKQQGVSQPMPKTQTPDNTEEIPDEVSDAIEQCEEILSMCDEVPEAGEDFAESVKESVSAVMETIERTNRVTERQWAAIDNWREGVGRWLHD
jgi:hypothetical protein